MLIVRGACGLDSEESGGEYHFDLDYLLPCPRE